jgi:carboxymethylenebutenolidase
MMTRLTASDGHRFECWMAEPVGPAWGGLVVLQEIFGVTDQLKGVAARYAALGLVAAVPALFDRQAPSTVVPFDEAPKGRALMEAADMDAALRDTAAVVAALADRGLKVAVMGFCWGGGLVIRAAQTLPIACGVSFYGTRLPLYLDRPMPVPVLGHFGRRDDHVPTEMREKAQAALPLLDMQLYEAGHAFANDARPAAHVPEAAALAHARTEAFLRRHLG